MREFEEVAQSTYQAEELIAEIIDSVTEMRVILRINGSYITKLKRLVSVRAGADMSGRV